jgi:GNAT superfamily N-acetyltransferase
VGWQFLSLNDAPDIDRSCFDCGNPGINNFFINSVDKYEDKGFSRVFLMVCDAKKVIGYYTLSNSVIPLHEVPNSYSRGLPRHDVPAVLIGQFGIDKTLQRRGLSYELLGDAYSRIALSFTQGAIAFNAVRVDTQDNTAKAFWQKQGFTCFKKTQNSLFVPIERILNEFDAYGA